MVGPVEKGGCLSLALVTPRAAYSHSASVSRRYSLPVFFDSQATYCVASSHDTLMTGRRPRPQVSSLGWCLQPPSLEQASHCSKVTSNLPTANGWPIVTLCCGPSFLSRPRSVSGEPIMNS